jgi:hypothetical protein
MSVALTELPTTQFGFLYCFLCLKVLGSPASYICTINSFPAFSFTLKLDAAVFPER